MPEFGPIDTLDELYNTPKPDEKDFTEEKYGANYALFYENAVKEYNAVQTEFSPVTIAGYLRNGVEKTAKEEI